MTAYKDFRKGILGDLLGLYEAKFAEQLNEIFNSERFVKALQTMLATSEEFRKVVGKGIETALTNLEFPTGADFEKLAERIEHLENTLFDVRSEIHGLKRTLEKNEAAKCDCGCKEELALIGEKIDAMLDCFELVCEDGAEMDACGCGCSEYDEFEEFDFEPAHEAHTHVSKEAEAKPKADEKPAKAKKEKAVKEAAKPKEQPKRQSKSASGKKAK